MNRVLILFVTLLSVILFNSCLGSGSGSGKSGGQGSGAETLYIGYYTEVDDPNDPTLGVLYMFLPDNDTSFIGKFFFSYAGCDGFYDIGNLNGNKTAATFSGKWDGNVDGLNIAGDFSGAYDAASFSYKGNWQKDGGYKVTSCHTIAGDGEFAIYQVGKGAINVSTDNAVQKPTISWSNDNNFSTLQIDVYDKACLAANETFSDCHMWETYASSGTTSGSVQYGQLGGNVPAKALVSGKEYVITVISIRAEEMGSVSFVAP